MPRSPPQQLPTTKPECADKGRRRTITYHVNDHCVVIDGEYASRRLSAGVSYHVLARHPAEPLMETRAETVRVDGQCGFPSARYLICRGWQRF